MFVTKVSVIGDRFARKKSLRISGIFLTKASFLSKKK